MRRSINLALVLAAVAVCCPAGTGQAAVPDQLSYQAYLTDPAGAAVDANLDITFRLYTVASGGTALWTQTRFVTVASGLLDVQLGGAAAPFPPGAFNTPLWIGIEVGSDGEMLPRRALTTTGYAFTADDALTVGGQSAAALDQSGHVADLGNPHSVSAAQAGAAGAVDLQNHANADAAHHARYTGAEAVAALQAHDGNGVAADTLDGLHASAFAEAGPTAAQFTNLWAEVVILQNHVTELQAAITNLQARNDALEELLQHFSLSGDNVYLTGANLHIRNGNGSSDGAVNGRGNLVIGYDEARQAGQSSCSLGAYTTPADCANNGGTWSVNHKTGSHVIVVGAEHNYSRHSGIVTGLRNTITGEYATVSGGHGNTASGRYASVSGGFVNVASGGWASVSAGNSNVASGEMSAASGGGGNEARGSQTSVSGGWSNVATDGSVSGGYGNTSSGFASWIAGGMDNTASGSFSSVTGGENNTASGAFASVSGGGSPLPQYGNHAYAEYSSILGGIFNVTGDPASGNPEVGAISTISGGDTNRTTGGHSSVSGGLSNTAAGFRSSVVGGDNINCAADACGEGVFVSSD